MKETYKDKIAIICKTKERKNLGFRIGRGFNQLLVKTDYHNFDNYKEEIKNKIDDYDFIIYDDNADNTDYDVHKKYKIPCFYLAKNTSIEGGERCVRQSQELDYIFYTQKIAKDVFPIEKSSWLPNAHDNNGQLVFPKIENRQFLVGCVGEFKKRKDRHNIQRLLLKEYSYKCSFRSGISYEELNPSYQNIKIAINPSLGDINLRTFEACGNQCVMLSNPDDRNGMKELGFIDNENCLIYKTDEEAIEKIKNIENDFDKQKDMSLKGYNLVMKKHRYIDRAAKIMKVLYNKF